MPEATREAVSTALARLLGDAGLRARARGGWDRDGAEYAWERRIDALEGFLEEVARPRETYGVERVVPGRANNEAANE